VPDHSSKKIFGGKFWQHGDLSAQRFIYREPHHQLVVVTSAGTLLLRIAVTMGGCHYQAIVIVIRISIVPF
jgi:hypothetical protein